jgi:L-threonylcarbamoyladenylate synthase
MMLDARTPSALPDSIEQASDLLRSGELVAFPTETVYGLGADARNPEAIARIFVAKGRPSDNPLIVHVASIESMRSCGIMDERAMKLAQACMPGPLTLVIPADPSIPANARAGLPTVAVRIPDHPVALALISRTGPLVAPSANLSGHPSPTTAEHVYNDLAGRIAAVLDGGPCRVGIESTVIDLSGPQGVILRPGEIGREEIERILGEPVLESTTHADAPKAPGMKYRHYAPSMPVRLVVSDRPPDLTFAGRRLVLTTERHLATFGPDARLLNEQSLYALLREADARGVDEVLIYASPGELGAGLLNRVRKAAGG